MKQRAEQSREQSIAKARVRSREQRAESSEQRAASREQRAQGRESRENAYVRMFIVSYNVHRGSCRQIVLGRFSRIHLGPWASCRVIVSGARCRMIASGG